MVTPHSLYPLKFLLVALCAGTSIVLFKLVTGYFIADGQSADIASMRAAAVIAFQFPESAAAKARSILGGHFVSALVGVLVSQLVDDRTIAAGLAVGIALGVMHVCRCMHPPGDGTAMVAVLGGRAVLDAGFSFVVLPTLLNALILTALASG